MKKIFTLAGALLCASMAYAQNTVTPLTVSSGFTIDAICATPEDEGKGLGPIDGHGSQLIAESYPGVVDGGLPEDGLLTTQAGHVYQLGNYMAANCFYLGITAKDAHELGTPTSGTVTFANPSSGAQLGILMVGTNRERLPLAFNLKVNYEDNTTSDLGSFEVSDWGQNNKNDAVFTFTKRFRFDASSKPESGTFRMSEVIATLDKDVKVKSVTITTECGDDDWGYGSLAFYAFSIIGTTSNIGVTTADNVKVQGIYTADGAKTNAPVKGVNIVKYSNGTTKKVVVK